MTGIEKTKTERLFGEIYSPYDKGEAADMSERCRLYRRDPQKYLFKDGLKYCRIIERCEYNLYPEPASMVFIELSGLLKIGDSLVDELGNEFVIDSFLHIGSGEIPEWYPNILPLVLTGECCCMGEYLARIPQ